MSRDSGRLRRHPAPAGLPRATLKRREIAAYPGIGDGRAAANGRPSGSSALMATHAAQRW